MKRFYLKFGFRLAAVAMSCFSFLFVSTLSHAAASGMPWESPLQTVLDSISGPVVQILGIIAIILFGLGLAFSESGGMLRKALWVLLGLSIAFSAVSWGISFLGFSGGLIV
jgi:type IV secretion system protein TrbC